MNRLTFTLMNEPVDRALDQIIKSSLESGVERATVLRYTIKVLFKNGIEMQAWNANKYYAWLQSGHIKQDGHISPLYEWKGARPSKQTMCDLDDAITQYLATSISTEPILNS